MDDLRSDRFNLRSFVAVPILSAPVDYTTFVAFYYIPVKG